MKANSQNEGTSRMLVWVLWLVSARAVKRFLFTPVIMAGMMCLLAGCEEDASAGQPPEDLTFVQLCDPQLGFGGYQHDSIALLQAVAQINEISPDMVVICGDLVHLANDTSYSDLAFILAELEVPWYAAPGNHDVENIPTLESLAYYRKMIGPDYYVKDTLGYVFVFVNSTLWNSPLEGEAEKQDDWLNGVMTGLTGSGRSVFVISHHQLFMQTPDEEGTGSPVSLEKRTELLTLFSDASVVAYLGGHTHTTLIREKEGMQLVHGETTSVNFDKRPLGFRVWTVSADTATHAFVPLSMEGIIIDDPLQQ